MGKISKEMQWRLEGISFALRYLESHDNDIEALKAEASRRGACGIPLTISETEEAEYSRRIKEAYKRALMALTVTVLHDEFGFGSTRLDRYRDRFNTIASCIADKYVTFDDLAQMIKDETGVVLQDIKVS